MSLVREALAKAEREAAAREAREQGLPAEVSRIPQPYRARRRPRWPLAAGLAAAALAGAVTAVVLVRREVSSVSTPAPRSADSPAVVATPPEASEKLPLQGEPVPARVPEPATAGTTRAATDSDSGADGGAAPAPPTPTAPTAQPPAIAAAESSATPSPPTRGAAPSEAALDASTAQIERRRSTAPAPAAIPSGLYVREVALGDGRSIQLGGIAWSSSAPLAYLNGRLVGVGEYVEGFRVVAIEPEAVRFDGGDGQPGLRFELRLR